MPVVANASNMSMRPTVIDWRKRTTLSEAAVTVTINDRPKAPPSWCDTFTKPDAAPVSLLSTFSIPKLVSGLMARPCPNPIRSMGKQMEYRYVSPCGKNESQINPPTSIDKPTDKMGILPYRSTKCGTHNAPQNVVSVMGRKAHPVSSGVKCSPICRNSDMAKL